MEESIGKIWRNVAPPPKFAYECHFKWHIFMHFRTIFISPVTIIGVTYDVIQFRQMIKIVFMDISCVFWYFSFQLSVEMFDYTEVLLDLVNAIFASFDMSRANSMTNAGQCRLVALIPCILDSCQLYDFIVKMMFRLHASECKLRRYFFGGKIALEGFSRKNLLFNFSRTFQHLFGLKTGFCDHRSMNKLTVINVLCIVYINIEIENVQVQRLRFFVYLPRSYIKSTFMVRTFIYVVSRISKCTND